MFRSTQQSSDRNGNEDCSSLSQEHTASNPKNKTMTIKRKCCAPKCSSTNVTSKMFAFPSIIGTSATGESVIKEDGLER